MNIDAAFHFDRRGRTAEVEADLHVRQMIEQLLFTNPGERVNRPDFGSGLQQLVFAPNSVELAATVQLTTQALLQQHLGDLIEIGAIDVTGDESSLVVSVSYAIRRTGRAVTAEFPVPGGSS
jgi:phage baseplate assembly protein W